MTKVTCSRTLEFDAGHRIPGHEGLCRYPHGHRYRVVLEAETRDGELDNCGRVIDFSVLKQKVGGWIQEHWDHAFLYDHNDLSVMKMLSAFQRSEHAGPREFALPGPPTAEFLAFYLLTEVCPELLEESGVEVRSIVVWETPNCCGTATHA